MNTNYDATRYGSKCVRAEKQKQRALKRKLLSSMPVDNKNLLGPKDLPSLWFRTNMLHKTNVTPQKMHYRLGSAFRSNCRKQAEVYKQSSMDENADPYKFFGLKSICTECKKNLEECNCDYDDIDYYGDYDCDDDYQGTWGTFVLKKVPEPKIEVKKTPTVSKQYEFGFEFILKGEKCSTIYSPKNQYLLSKAWKDGYNCFPIHHEVQKGPKKGTIVLHKVDFNSKKVMTTTGITHTLLMTDKTPKKVDSTPVVPSDPFKKIDWRLKMLSRQLEASDVGLSDCSSILCDEREWELSEWEMSEWEEYLLD